MKIPKLFGYNILIVIGFLVFFNIVFVLIQKKIESKINM